MIVAELRVKSISPAFLMTEHTGFYGWFGWDFLYMVQGNAEPDMTRMHIG